MILFGKNFFTLTPGPNQTSFLITNSKLEKLAEILPF